MTLTAVNRKGDCEGCDKKDVYIFFMHGNMWLCKECRDTDLAVMAEKKQVGETLNTILQESRAVDMSIELKPDVFMAQTVPAVELLAAINADEAIPADKKEYAYAVECRDRFLHLKKVIFEEEKALTEKKNQMRMWQANAQSAAGKLREELRGEFRELDINYQPTPAPKPSKKSSGVKKGKTFGTKDLNALNAACQKYGVPAAAVRSMMVGSTKNVEDVARELAEQMGLLPKK